jgi:hypothetical protein
MPARQGESNGKVKRHALIEDVGNSSTQSQQTVLDARGAEGHAFSLLPVLALHASQLLIGASRTHRQ